VSNSKELINRIKNQEEKVDELIKEKEKIKRKEFNIILKSEEDIGDLSLEEIIDTEKIQSLMDDFYSITGMGIGIIDLQGKALVTTGWQDICTKFHRANPQTLKNCMDSILVFSQGTKQGEYKFYLCKNHLMDISSPIFIGGKHLGNIFLGQFFFEDELPDIEFFREQAKKFGFNEKEYIEAVRKIPIWSKEKVFLTMKFYIKLSNMLSMLSLSNINHAKVLAEKEKAQEEVKYQNSLLEEIFKVLPVGLWFADKTGKLLRGNPEGKKIWGAEPKVGIEEYGVFKAKRLSSGKAIEADDWALAHTIKEGTVTLNELLEIQAFDGKKKIVLNYTLPIKNAAGVIDGAIIVNNDITDLKIKSIIYCKTLI